MGLPLVTEKSAVGVDVAVLAGVPWAGVGGAVLDEGAGVVLGPEAVEGEGEALGALGGVGVGVAELGRPGEVEEVVVEGLGGGLLLDGAGLGLWWGCCAGLGLCVAGGDGEEQKKELEGSLHGRSQHNRVSSRARA